MNLVDKAPRACRDCRRLKRKCSRDLPICSLCVRLNKTCQYPARPGVSDVEVPGQEEVLTRIKDLEKRLDIGLASSARGEVARSAILGIEEAPNNITPTTHFPHAFFLDIELFTPLSQRFLGSIGSRVNVSPETLQQIGPHPKTIWARYFATTHTWFSVLSQKRLHQYTMEFGEPYDPVICLLLLSMKLVSGPLASQGTPDTNALYTLVRNLCNALEASTVSLDILQAIILLALYELGHGIFPAAYLTVGRAARLASLMGLSNRSGSTQLFKPADTWTAREEGRRSWWAVFSLERVINIGPSGLHLAVPEPTQATLLPIADSRWDQGEIGPSEALFTFKFSHASNFGPFARFCQSSHVLSMVLAHRNARQITSDQTATLSEALQLHSTLVALDQYLVHQLDAALDMGNGTCGVDLAICCSARMVLYEMYSCNEVDKLAGSLQRISLETEMQTTSLDGLKQILSERVPKLAKVVLVFAKTAVDIISPLVLECLYAAACVSKWFVNENRDFQSIFLASTDALRVIKKWSLASLYLQMLQSS